MQFLNHTYSIPLVWAQNFNSIKRLYILQKKSLILTYFLNCNTHRAPLFKDSNTVIQTFKHSDSNIFPIKMFLKILILLRIISTKLFSTPSFTLITNSHTHNTVRSILGCPKISPHKTKICGRQPVNISEIYIWNYLQRHHKNITFYQLSLTRLKKLIMQYYFSNYY